MYYEEYGSDQNPVIVFLHGANFIHSFGRQYVLSDRFHIIVPHIMGYGNEANKTFDAEKATVALAEFIRGLGNKVSLVGFSLGAQLAVKLIAEYAELFEKAIIVSPWLIKKEPELSQVMNINKKQLDSMKKPFLCNIIGLMNGLPKSQRTEFVKQMQNVSYETQRNMVDNGITLETVRGFENAKIPMIGIAGVKEQHSIIDSVKSLSEMNDNCNIEIWEKAAHNIPPVFAKRFNSLINDFIGNNQKRKLD
ncbi:MAG TPA: alpha/beta hydrolase [Clostridiaceae bacterium]|nr:alpha/beta hydrolase [Clostridiaceae bacterium]